MTHDAEHETFDDGAIEKQDVDHAESASVLEEDAIEAKRVLRKIDFRLIPLLLMLYTLTFLDRVNIGNAAVWNLESDLHMKGYDYNIVVLGRSSIFPGVRPAFVPFPILTASVLHSLHPA